MQTHTAREAAVVAPLRNSTMGRTGFVVSKEGPSPKSPQLREVE